MAVFEEERARFVETMTVRQVRRPSLSNNEHERISSSFLIQATAEALIKKLRDLLPRIVQNRQATAADLAASRTSYSILPVPNTLCRRWRTSV